MKQGWIHGFAAVCMALAGALAAAPASAHDYLLGDNWANLQELAAAMETIMGELMTPTAGPEAGCNLWIGECDVPPIWAAVSGQAGPGWIGYDHGRNPANNATVGTGILDDHHLALLDAILDPNSCLDGLHPDTVDAVRAAFAANLLTVMDTEMTVQQVRISAELPFPLPNIDQREDITTGQMKTVNLAGLYTAEFFVPHLFKDTYKEDGVTIDTRALLSEAHPLLRDALANLGAAYMTIGDTYGVAYLQAFMGRLALSFVVELLPGLLAQLGKDADNPKADADWGIMLNGLSEEAIKASLDIGDAKALCPPWGNVPNLDQTVRIEDIDIIGTVDVRVRLEDWRLCNTLNGMAGAFTCSRYACMTALLSATDGGDLNGDLRSNLASFQQAGGVLEGFLHRESAWFPAALSIAQQPEGSAGAWNTNEFSVSVGMEYGVNPASPAQTPMTSSRTACHPTAIRRSCRALFPASITPGSSWMWAKSAAQMPSGQR